MGYSTQGWLVAVGAVSLALALFLLWLTDTDIWNKEYREYRKEFRHIQQMEKEGDYLYALMAYSELRDDSSQHPKFRRKADEKLRSLCTDTWEELLTQIDRIQTRRQLGLLMQDVAEPALRPAPARDLAKKECNSILIAKAQRADEAHSNMLEAKHLADKIEAPICADDVYSEAEWKSAAARNAVILNRYDKAQRLFAEATSLYKRARYETEQNKPLRAAIELIRNLASQHDVTIENISKSVDKNGEIVLIEGYACDSPVRDGRSSQDNSGNDKWEKVSRFQALLKKSFSAVDVLEIREEPVVGVRFKFALETGNQQTAKVKSTEHILVQACVVG